MARASYRPGTRAIEVNGGALSRDEALRLIAELSDALVAEALDSREAT